MVICLIMVVEKISSVMFVCFLSDVLQTCLTHKCQMAFLFFSYEDQKAEIQKQLKEADSVCVYCCF